MKHTDAERIASALILAFLIHLVIGVILAFTVPWERELEDEFVEPIRVVLDDPPPPEREPQRQPAPEPEPEPPPEPTPEPAPETESATPAPDEAPSREAAETEPSPGPSGERQARQPQQADAWDIPEDTDSSQPAAPPPERSIDRQALRQQSIPEGPSGEFAAEQQEEMERRFAALEEEISQIERLQEELLAARESAPPGSRSSAEIDQLQRRLDQALSDLNRPGEEDAVVRVGPEGEPTGTEAARADGPRTSGGRGLVAGDPRPDFSGVRWRDALPGEVVITVRFWVNRSGEVVDHEEVPADLSLLARSGLREAIDRTVAGWRFQAAPNAGATEAGRVVYVIER